MSRSEGTAYPQTGGPYTQFLAGDRHFCNREESADTRERHDAAGVRRLELTLRGGVRLPGHVRPGLEKRGPDTCGIDPTDDALDCADAENCS